MRRAAARIKKRAEQQLRRARPAGDEPAHRGHQPERQLRGFQLIQSGPAALDGAHGRIKQPERGAATVDLSLPGLRIKQLGVGTHTLRKRKDPNRPSTRAQLGRLTAPFSGRIDLKLGGKIPDGWLQRILPVHGKSVPEMTQVALDVHLGGKLSSPQIGVSINAQRLVYP